MAIAIDEKASPFAKRYLLRKAISHIRCYSAWKIWIYPSLFSLVTAGLIFFYTQSFFLADLISYGVGTLFFIGYSRFYDRCAEKKAIEASTSEERKAALLYYRSLQQRHRELAGDPKASFLEKIWLWCKYDSRGDDRFDLFTPSLSTRITKLIPFPKNKAIN